MKPRIGITTSHDGNKQSLRRDYVTAVEKAGGLPLPVPMLETADAAEAFASLLDGLIFTGGPGITRGLQGTLPQDLAEVDAVRDASDTHIYRAVSDRPVLGICYGMQFVNAMRGGTIHGDFSTSIEAPLNHSKNRGGESHLIHINPDSHLYQILRSESLEVNSYHVQVLASVGEGLRVSATAPDGVIEGVESEDGRILGVQFHPESMGEAMDSLFLAFVDRCRDR